MNKKNSLIALSLALILMLTLLAGCGETAKKSAAYEVFVTDTAGKAVPGAVIQFCSDEECLMGETGADGVARFEKEAGSYTIHVLKVPEGFAADSSEYAAPAEPGQVSIVLK